MALYAFLEGEVIHAADAAPGGSYRCLECAALVKVRKGRLRFPHFYHVQSSPQCYLYRKSEDHLLLQLQLQKFLPPDETQIERPFFDIYRIADLVWEKQKITFEIQCSPLDLGQAHQRIIDYDKSGYEVIWLFDDRIFNRRQVRPAEAFARARKAYFFHFNRSALSHFYDQFEVIQDSKRLKKSRPLFIDLRQPKTVPQLEWPEDLPTCVRERLPHATGYFYGDLIHRAIQSSRYPSYALSLSRWCSLETQLTQEKRTRLKKFLKRYVVNPYFLLLKTLLERVH